MHTQNTQQSFRFYDKTMLALLYRKYSKYCSWKRFHTFLPFYITVSSLVIHGYTWPRAIVKVKSYQFSIWFNLFEFIWQEKLQNRLAAISKKAHMAIFHTDLRVKTSRSCTHCNIKLVDRSPPFLQSEWANFWLMRDQAKVELGQHGEHEWQHPAPAVWDRAQ